MTCHQRHQLSHWQGSWQSVGCRHHQDVRQSGKPPQCSAWRRGGRRHNRASIRLSQGCYNLGGKVLWDAVEAVSGSALSPQVERGTPIKLGDFSGAFVIATLSQDKIYFWITQLTQGVILTFHPECFAIFQKNKGNTSRCSTCRWGYSLAILAWYLWRSSNVETHQYESNDNMKKNYYYNVGNDRDSMWGIDVSN